MEQAERWTLEGDEKEEKEEVRGNSTLNLCLLCFSVSVDDDDSCRLSHGLTMNFEEGLDNIKSMIVCRRAWLSREGFPMKDSSRSSSHPPISECPPSFINNFSFNIISGWTHCVAEQAVSHF